VTRVRRAVRQRPVVRTALFLAQNGVHGVRSLVRKQLWRPPVEGGPRYHLAAMIRVKDEGRFLPEWIAHHVNLGVEHCFVYDNGSIDGTRERLTPFVERGLATHVQWPQVPASPGAEHDFLTRFGASCRWVAFFDADELLFESVPGTLIDVLGRRARRPAVAVNTRYFGSAGHRTVPSGLVTERFDRAGERCSSLVKVVAQPARIVGVRNSHNFYYRAGRLAVTAEGRRVFGSRVAPPERPSLVLHHYVYRSTEDYERKARRGYVDQAGAREQARNLAAAEREFDRHNDVHVPPDPAVVRATSGLLRDLGFPAELYEPVPA
jgi:hypothetical protein